MGVDILYFIDHDLPTDNADVFLTEFRKRAGKNKVVLYDDNNNDNNQNEGDENPKKNTWKIIFNGTFEKSLSDFGRISIFYEDEHLKLELYLYKKVVEVFDMQIDRNNIPPWCRWYHIIQSFESNNPYNAKDWVKTLRDNYKKYLVPLFHSSKVLLTADSSSYRHETLYSDYLMDKGMSIEEALEKNNEFSLPCKVLKNDDVFCRHKSDYLDEGEDDIGALVLFDL